jgi:hypothetical protein
MELQLPRVLEKSKMFAYNSSYDFDEEKKKEAKLSSKQSAFFKKLGTGRVCRNQYWCAL